MRFPYVALASFALLLATTCAGYAGYWNFGYYGEIHGTWSWYLDKDGKAIPYPGVMPPEAKPSTSDSPRQPDPRCERLPLYRVPLIRTRAPIGAIRET